MLYAIDEYFEANNVVPQMEKLLHHFHGDRRDRSHHHFGGMRSHIFQLQKLDNCLDVLGRWRIRCFPSLSMVLVYVVCGRAIKSSFAGHFSFCCLPMNTRAF